MTRKRSHAFFLAASVLAGQIGALTDARIITLAESGFSVAELLRLVQRGPRIKFELTPTGADDMLRVGVAESAIRRRG